VRLGAEDGEEESRVPEGCPRCSGDSMVTPLLFGAVSVSYVPPAFHYSQESYYPGIRTFNCLRTQLPRMT
jgi:hypothetical protein